MKIVTLYGNEIKTEDDFHRIIKQALDFPDYYGENLDALWDCLHYIELPILIEWTNFSQSKQNISDYMERIVVTFSDAETHLTGFMVKYLD